MARGILPAQGHSGGGCEFNKPLNRNIAEARSVTLCGADSVGQPASFDLTPQEQSYVGPRHVVDVDESLAWTSAGSRAA
jgi:hypothetical protein